MPFLRDWWWLLRNKTEEMTTMTFTFPDPAVTEEERETLILRLEGYRKMTQGIRSARRMVVRSPHASTRHTIKRYLRQHFNSVFPEFQEGFSLGDALFRCEQCEVGPWVEMYEDPRRRDIGDAEEFSGTCWACGGSLSCWTMGPNSFVVMDIPSGYVVEWEELEEKEP